MTKFSRSFSPLDRFLFFRPETHMHSDDAQILRRRRQLRANSLLFPADYNSNSTDKWRQKLQVGEVRPTRILPELAS